MKSADLIAIYLLAASAATAQSLPPPSRTVYKCEQGGKIRYSDAPCLGAKKVDVEPTRGLNGSSGKELMGQDVQRERQREAFAEGLRPITGMDPGQLARAGRRSKLLPETQRACQHLDRDLPYALKAERDAGQPTALKAAQERLLALRTAFRKLGCE